MFIKVGKGFLNVDSITLIEAEKMGDTHAVIAWLNRRMFESEENSIILCSGTKEKCQSYMHELELELAALGPMIRIDIPETKECTCGAGNDAKVYEHKSDCALYAPF